MKNLKSYLKDASLTQSEFAKLVDVHQGTIAKLCGVNLPSWELAAKIEKATGGAVPVAVWAIPIENKNSDAPDSVQGGGV